MAAYAFNPNTQEAETEADDLYEFEAQPDLQLSFKPARVTYWDYVYVDCVD